MKILFIARKSLYSQAGGDSLQIKETAAYLRLLGHEITISTSKKMDPKNFDILHFFNLIRPAQFLYYLQFDKPIIVTSIYVDYSEYESKNARGLRKIILKSFGKFGLEYFKTIGRWVNKTDGFPGISYILNGQKSSIQKIIKGANTLIVASHQERDLIREDFNLEVDSFCKISLGSEHFEALESSETRSGIACIARIEGLKNQLQLIKATKEEKDRIIIIGQAAANQLEYAEECKNIAGENVQFTGQLKADKIAKILSETQVHAMISFYETTGLSSLEALKSGCQIVISEKGGQKEIFGDHAFYADPENLDSIKNAIVQAKNAKLSHKDWVMKNFSWEKSAQEISDIYLRIRNDK